MLRYARTVIGYHGCDESMLERLLRGGPFRPSTNAYDWLGSGIYFWEYGPDRALRFAEEQRQRGKVKRPAVVGAVLQLGRCFDLLDTRFTEELTEAYRDLAAHLRVRQRPMPTNRGRTPDRELRNLDSAVLNWHLLRTEARGSPYDSVRCAFVEGEPVFEGSGIYKKTHVQIAVRNPTCIVGIFVPTQEVEQYMKFEDAALVPGPGQRGRDGPMGIRTYKRGRKQTAFRLKPLPEAGLLRQVHEENRRMTPQEFLQSLVDTGIFTPSYRLRAPYQRLAKEGYVYAPKGMKPEWLLELRQLSLRLQREARRSRPKAEPRQAK